MSCVGLEGWGVGVIVGSRAVRVGRVPQTTPLSSNAVTRDRDARRDELVLGGLLLLLPP